MPSYPVSVRRCQYIKANGTQCGSPALRDEKYCHFHMQWSLQNREINMNFNVRGTITLPTLEDANSIQVGLAEVMRLLVTNHDALGYFARAYNFKVVGAVIPSVTDQAAPSAQEMGRLTETIKSTGALARIGAAKSAESRPWGHTAHAARCCCIR